LQQHNIFGGFFTMSTLSVFETQQVFLRAGNETLDPSKPADMQKIVERLSAPGAMWVLTRFGQEAGVVALVKALPHDAQTAILAVPNAVCGLAVRGQAQAAAEVVALIKALPHDAQTTILTALNAVGGLANNGQAAEVVALVKALPHDAQTAILAVHDTVSELALNGQAAAVVALVEALPHDAQTAIILAPNAQWGLANNGQRAAVKSIVESLRAGWEATPRKPSPASQPLGALQNS
jgi:hypothetical protein